MKNNISSEVTDLTYLKQVSNGDNNFIIEMIDVFLRETPLVITNLEQHLKNKDWEKLRAVAHKMKPSCSFFGLKDLHITANSLEEYSDKKVHLDRLPELIEQVRLTCTKAMEELKGKK